MRPVPCAADRSIGCGTQVAAHRSQPAIPGLVAAVADAPSVAPGRPSPLYHRPIPCLEKQSDPKRRKEMVLAMHNDCTAPVLRVADRSGAFNAICPVQTACPTGCNSKHWSTTEEETDRTTARWPPSHQQRVVVDKLQTRIWILKAVKTPIMKRLWLQRAQRTTKSENEKAL